MLLAHEDSQDRDRVIRLLTREFRVVGAYSDGRAVLRDCKQLQPDIVILDASRLGDVSGIEVAQHLRWSGHAARIIFLTMQEDVDFLAVAIGSGGSGYVVKSRMDSELPAALQQVRQQRLYVSAPVLARVGHRR